MAAVTAVLTAMRSNVSLALPHPPSPEGPSLEKGRKRDEKGRRVAPSPLLARSRAETASFPGESRLADTLIVSATSHLVSVSRQRAVSPSTRAANRTVTSCCGRSSTRRSLRTRLFPRAFSSRTRAATGFSTWPSRRYAVLPAVFCAFRGYDCYSPAVC